jgi:hypothetical protein
MCFFRNVNLVEGTFTQLKSLDPDEWLLLPGVEQKALLESELRTMQLLRQGSMLRIEHNLRTYPFQVSMCV